MTPTEYKEAQLAKPDEWESLLGAIARGWCYEENANKTMDTELALAIAKEVSALYAQPQHEWVRGECVNCGASMEQEQGEPVAKVCHDLEGHIGWNPSLTELPDEGVALYTAPQQHKPLTEDAIHNIWLSMWGNGAWSTRERRRRFARAIEAAHGIKEKNNG